MAKKFSDLVQETMSPESITRAKRRSVQMRTELPVKTVRDASGLLQDALAQDEKTGDLENNAQLTALASEQQESDPLAAARKRGTQFALNEWEKPENLTLQAAACYAGVSSRTINARRQRQQLYAMVAPNKSRGFRYPQWQFNADPERISAAISAFVAAGQCNSWVLHSFMMRTNPGLDGMRPCDYIADSSKCIKRLVQVIQCRFATGDQG